MNSSSSGEPPAWGGRCSIHSMRRGHWSAGAVAARLHAEDQSRARQGSRAPSRPPSSSTADAAGTAPARSGQLAARVHENQSTTSTSCMSSSMGSAQVPWPAQASCRPTSWRGAQVASRHAGVFPTRAAQAASADWAAERTSHSEDIASVVGCIGSRNSFNSSRPNNPKSCGRVSAGSTRLCFACHSEWGPPRSASSSHSLVPSFAVVAKSPHTASAASASMLLQPMFAIAKRTATIASCAMGCQLRSMSPNTARGHLSFARSARSGRRTSCLGRSTKVAPKRHSRSAPSMGTRSSSQFLHLASCCATSHASSGAALAKKSRRCPCAATFRTGSPSSCPGIHSKDMRTEWSQAASTCNASPAAAAIPASTALPASSMM
mmetsp:Transcript_106614/g.301650  ORF Transcript_106614/g.301650 Transcript_106614/m.301650 type:complete len:378 (-) Transcript_106614:188-1321(-)